MTKAAFNKGMVMLTVYYNNFEFNILPDTETEKLKYQVWQNALSSIPEDIFEKVITKYCISNVFAPNSPTAIIAYYEQQLLEQEPSAQEEWEEVLKGIRKHGLRYNSDRFYQSLKPFTAECARKIESRLAELSESNREFVMRDFIDLYNGSVKIKVKNQLMLQNDKLKLIE